MIRVVIHGAFASVFGTIVAIAAQPIAPPAPEAQMRNVTQRVRVTATDGTPIAHLPLGANFPLAPSRALEPWSNYTDLQGIIERTARVEVEDRSMSVRVTSKVDPAASRAPFIVDPESNLKDLRRRYAFLHSYTIAVSGNEPILEFPIHVRPAVTITGSVSMPGRPRGVMVGAVGVVGYSPELVTGLQAKTGSFSLDGVPKGVPVELAVWYGSQITFHQIGALQADGEVPPIVVPAPARLVPLSISFPPSREIGNGQRLQYPAALFIRIDGQLIYELRSAQIVNKNISSRRLLGSFDIGIDNEEPSVPPGTYLVVPKLLMFDREDIALLYALRAGHDFSTSGIPIITVAPSTTPQMVNIDWFAAEAAARSTVTKLLAARLPELGPDPKPYVAPPVPPAPPSPPAPPPAPPGGGG